MEAAGADGGQRFCGISLAQWNHAVADRRDRRVAEAVRWRAMELQGDRQAAEDAQRIEETARELAGAPAADHSPKSGSNGVEKYSSADRARQFLYQHHIDETIKTEDDLEFHPGQVHMIPATVEEIRAAVNLPTAKKATDVMATLTFGDKKGYRAYKDALNSEDSGIICMFLQWKERYESELRKGYLPVKEVPDAE